MKRLIRSLMVLSLLLQSGAGAAAWQDWDAFANGFITDDGRVVDWTADARTVSEGQAYALFFALVANDSRRFERILQWTEQNLAMGDLSSHLSAWLWGSKGNGEPPGIIDSNPATDADLWIAYTLLEAARLWNKPQYETMAGEILRLVREQSISTSEEGYPLMLPGPHGFSFPDRTRLNPSYYVPVQLLRFEEFNPDGPWLEMLYFFVSTIADIAPAGRVPDWSQFGAHRHSPDRDTGGVGSYDAIRCYLWSGFGPTGRGMSEHLTFALKPFAEVRVNGHIPERWSARNTLVEGHAPVGFYAALLPFYRAIGDKEHARMAREVITEARHDGSYGTPARYYDQVLVLFGKGYDDGRFRFSATGRLEPQWAR